jgi:hypothetical protein
LLRLTVPGHSPHLLECHLLRQLRHARSGVWLLAGSYGFDGIQEPELEEVEGRSRWRAAKDILAAVDRNSAVQPGFAMDNGHGPPEQHLD